ncbi:MAG TPA: hypothetical protein VFC70_00800 [Oscillospiraceae bacterium]|nr:hypothetical protein [Oscillospiraceae bacterium]
MSFKEIDLSDIFFDSLKSDYRGFKKWYLKKAYNDEKAYVLADNGVQGFLYLKEEYEEDNSITPAFDLKKRLKVGTFKINAHGTKLGERFVKIIIDEIYESDFDEAYVTIFSKHIPLINLLKRFGFVYHGTKKSESGVEDVYVKYSDRIYNDLFMDYPKIDMSSNRKFLLAIWPKYHTRMFPDSKLKTEKGHIIEDISFTNSVEKIYLSAAYNLGDYKKGDLIVIYRTAENYGRAWYEAVATSICTVIEIKNISEFTSCNDFIQYCVKYSVFTEAELRQFWSSRKYPHLIRMIYNIALNKRPIRKQLIEDVGLDGDDRWVALLLTDHQFLKILELGETNENLIIY